MLRGSRPCRMRMPLLRRPRERPWEMLNSRDFYQHEGVQNFKTGFVVLGVVWVFVLIELHQQWQRIRMRGDTCPACERAREHYRERIAAKQRELSDAELHAGTPSSPSPSTQQQQQQQPQPQRR